MRTARPRRGFVLIIVLVVVVILSLGAYAFSELMLSHRESVDLSGRQLQARVVADSGVESLRLFLAQDKLTQTELGGIYDNPGLFQGVLVMDSPEPRERTRFTLLAPAMDQEGFFGGVRFGLENESTRLNLNALEMVEKQQVGAGRQLLMSLPGCTEEIADAILDWIDADDEQREYGAEIDYYTGLTPAYAPKNGPLDTVEELLLVRGVTPQLLFGLDVNRNGVVDNFEQTGQDTSLSSSTTTGVDLASQSGTGITVEADMSLGWTPYLTLYSMERNLNSQGKKRVNLNQEDMQKLYNELKAVLPEEMASFIVAYRQNGPYTGDEEGEKAGGEPDLEQPGKIPLLQVLDLIGQKTEMGSGDDSTVLASPFPEDLVAMAFYMPLLMDNCTVSDAPMIPGRININQAPKTILAGIPGMSEAALTEIISRRNAEPPEELPNRRWETWLLVEGIVTLTEMKALAPFVTCSGDVYRAQVVGYFEDGSASSRAEVVIDATAANPRVLFWRDLSHLGRGFALETLGVELMEIY